MGVNNEITLPLGHVSSERVLGRYYQDLSPALYHYENDSIGKFDEHGIPYVLMAGKPLYTVIYIIQYALIHIELFHQDKNDAHKKVVKDCLDWIESKMSVEGDMILWRNSPIKQYDLKEGWVSGMYQGMGISLFLRAAEIFENDHYRTIADKVFNSFDLSVQEGGATRYDSQGNIWFEEYPTEPPSFVLNGYIYSILGIYDYWRVTRSEKAKELFDASMNTLEANLHKYHKWYWSVYDQYKKQLVSYYYQKNVHIPLMDILYKITDKPIFEHYSKRWRKQLNSGFCRLYVKMMYRIQPRIQKLLNGRN